MLLRSGMERKRLFHTDRSDNETSSSIHDTTPRHTQIRNQFSRRYEEKRNPLRYVCFFLSNIRVLNKKHLNNEKKKDIADIDVLFSLKENVLRLSSRVLDEWFLINSNQS